MRFFPSSNPTLRPQKPDKPNWHWAWRALARVVVLPGEVRAVKGGDRTAVYLLQMADREHLSVLRRGPKAWNNWRLNHAEIAPDLIGIVLCEHLEELDLSGIDLKGVTLRDADLSRVDLTRANLSGADMTGAALSGAYLIWATIHAANLSGADISQCDLSGADVSGSDLSGVDLTEADLSGARFDDANLVGAVLSKAKCGNAQFLGAKFKRAKLSDTDFSGSDLSGADLAGADLRGAKFIGARLRGTNLRDAKLSQTNLSGAYLGHADFSGATLTDEQVLGLLAESAADLADLQVRLQLLAGRSFAGDHVERLTGLARDLVRLSVDKIIATFESIRDNEGCVVVSARSVIIDDLINRGWVLPRAGSPLWPWPITEVAPGPGGGNALFEHQQSALNICGYRVGRTNPMPESERRKFLDYFLGNRLPAVVEEIFPDQYGSPGSARRLQKMANVIATVCRVRKRRHDAANYEQAIAEWESDLAYLRKAHYERGQLQFQSPRFDWPET
jgi:uncharacterized protein YjbI with pentapeptide repeats